MWALALVQLCGARRLGPLALVATAHQPDRPVSHHRRIRARRDRSTAATRRSPASPWAERLLPTVYHRRDRRRRVELADRSHAGALVEAVRTGGARLRDRRSREQVRLRRRGSHRSPVVAGASVGPAHVGRRRDERGGSATSSPCCSTVSLRSCSSRSSFAAARACRRACGRRRGRRSSPPWCSASPSSGRSRRPWLRHRSAGTADGPRRSGWSVRASSSAATAPSRCCSSGRSRCDGGAGPRIRRARRPSSWARSRPASTRPTRWRGSSVIRPRGVVIRGADTLRLVGGDDIARRRRVDRSCPDHDRRPRRCRRRSRRARRADRRELGHPRRDDDVDRDGGPAARPPGRGRPAHR